MTLTPVPAQSPEMSTGPCCETTHATASGCLMPAMTEHRGLELLPADELRKRVLLALSVLQHTPQPTPTETRAAAVLRGDLDLGPQTPANPAGSTHPATPQHRRTA